MEIKDTPKNTPLNALLMLYSLTVNILGILLSEIVMLWTLGRIHVVKVPSKNPSFFPYSHFRDEHAAGPILEAHYSMEQSILTLRIVGLAKLKPNIQVNPKLRIDIYGPHSTLHNLATHITRNLGAGVGAASAAVNPERARKGHQTLPRIDQQYIIEITSVHGICAGFTFSGANKFYLDHERPADGHIEMIGPEFHIGIPLQTLSGAREEDIIICQDVPEDELRVKGETNPVPFAPFEIQITLGAGQARKFAATIEQAPAG